MDSPRRARTSSRDKNSKNEGETEMDKNKERDTQLLGMKSESFKWRALESNDGWLTYRKVQEMSAHRKSIAA